jgi:mRNA interferase MazF
LKRGEVWTAAGGPDYAGKPRPVVIIQDDRFDATASITVCGVTRTDIGPAAFRIRIDPTGRNGLHAPSYLMVDKIASISRHKVQERLGDLDDRDLSLLNQAIATFLGLGEA